ncbi:MAG: dehydrogenase protein [Ramlibacter sp.]|jgi:carbon-monoxide dehydrogenase medium subunit|uniref:FAD binding domain-containing protein n=1 Tax=Ramlibacter sp. TaxID=1917967 RepID=UPI00261A96A0|nr:FAD binding domain-containing protein [Ramlibacter sp.]MDB5753074.1 dehydrogenase protein [Ramlibacter sp.]
MKRTGHGLIATTARSLAPFRLYRPESVADAVDSLARCPGATLLAGGTDVAGQINAGLQPHAVVELRRVRQLEDIHVTPDGLSLGAAVTHDRGARDPSVAAAIPGLAAAWRQIATVRIRNRATVGGNLMARKSRYEMSVMLMALRARLHFAGPAGACDIAAEALWTDAAQSDSLLTHVVLPLPPGTVFGYDRSLRPTVTLAVALHRDGTAATGHAAIATEWLSPCLLPLPPMRDLRDARQDAQTIAAMALAQLPGDFADVMTPHWYLARVGKVLLARTLREIAND